MAYPYGFIKVSFGGTLFGGADIWTNAINFGLPAQDAAVSRNIAPLEATSFETALKKWFVSEGMAISTYAQLEWCKIASIGKDGLYAEDPIILDFDPVAGSYNRYVPAPQITLALSMQSAKRRAPGKDARIYPPLYSISPGANGKIPSDEATAARNAVMELINDLEVSLNMFEFENPVQAIVASQKTEENNPIVKVRVGRVLDTQRRRRNRITEEYTPSALIVRDVTPPAE